MADTILWRSMDEPGHEAVRLERGADGWILRGTAVLLHEGRACRLDYTVRTDEAWRSTGARVQGWMGDEPVDVTIAVGADGHWTLNGAEVPEVAGCVDVDLNFSPSTNLLPIRRLGLDVGGEGEVHAAWLRFPSFRLERLQQTYRRTGELSYRYESADGAFMRDLDVNAAGLVTRYPGLWEAEPVGG
ncbi:putative glycolipid-binding domain-containing protein [Longimicrobium terrae]|uniref:Glycolipid-binding domain-containing protein n=1 Tax=Longimicrobium terrae TaxID=1639882 RepID=A0A841H045_9BACT|nr:putative glycolipid-binding domain-containing protein [Longimicrobium terrae]MBB4637009.1 hypothetical protein [Longimicrobium terrae]MBB6071383.1 hypothetical protein [Longimicrobium terrae]NNC31400.1 putative glycolipid-binding domain-containing protein [Longimicrobium terrae]